MAAYFAYYRVSTQKQGASGLRLEAQQAAVVSFLKGERPRGEHIEVESGKKNQRPQLLAAMAAARAAGGATHRQARPALAQCQLHPGPA